MLMLPPSLIAPLRCLLCLLLLSLVSCQRWQSNEQLLAHARQYRQEGKDRAAVIELKNVLQADPQHGVARTLLGQIYLEQGDVVSAEKELRRALSFGVGKEQVMPALGQVLLLQGEYDKVLAETGAAPAHPEWTALRAGALLGLGKLDQAEALYAGLLRQRPDDGAAPLGLARVAALRNQNEAAMRLVDQAVAGHPDDVDALRFRADLLHLQGNNAAALQDDLRIVQLRPEQVQARVDIANLHLQAGRFAQAEAEMAKARKIAPNNLLVVYTQALLDFREGKLQPALDQLQLVLRAAPDHMPSVLLMGSVQLGLGSLPQAEQFLRKFLENYPQNLYATKMLSSVMLKSGQPDAAIALLAPLLEAHQDDVELMALAGEAYMRTRQFDKAEAYYQKASALAPKMAMLHTALGMTRLGQGDSARAIGELEQASGLDGANPRAGVLLVLTYLRGKEIAKALDSVNRLIEQQGNNPLLHNLKGGVLMANQDVAGARASFTRATVLDPLYLPALQNLAQLDLMEKKPEQARQRFLAALSRDKKNAAIMTALAKLATSQGRNAEAVHWLELSSKDNPDALAPAMLLANFYTQSGDQQKSLPLAQKLQATNPGSPDAMALLAEAQSRSGNHDAALESFNKLAQLLPRAAAVQMRIAAEQMTLNDVPGALASLQKTLVLQSDFPAARATLVKLLTERGEYSQAAAVVRILRQQHPDAPLGYKLDGDILMAQNKPAAALVAYQQAYALDHSGPVLIPVFNAMKAAGRGQEAYASMQQWLHEHPADTPTRLHFASSLQADHKYAEAIAQLEQIVQREPNNMVALNDLAWACLQQQDGRALAFAERARALAPDNAAVLDTLGWILVQQGGGARALPLLRRAAQLAPAVEDIRYHFGLALLKSGDARAARPELERLLKSPDATRRAEVQALLAQM